MISMKGKFNVRAKGFTLLEVIVVIVILGILAGILVPSLLGYVQKAKVAVAVADAKTIKTSIESSLMVEYNLVDQTNRNKAINKILNLEEKGKVPENQRKKEIVGGFTNVSWDKYKANTNVSATDYSQLVDKQIAKNLDDTFSEKWEKGNCINPLSYSGENGCRDFVKANNSSFGLWVIYSFQGEVIMMQIYRKGILVTYIDGEFIPNTNKKAGFLGNKSLTTIFTDVNREAPSKYYGATLSTYQRTYYDDGTYKDFDGWFKSAKK